MSNERLFFPLMCSVNADIRLDLFIKIDKLKLCFFTFISLTKISF